MTTGEGRDVGQQVNLQIRFYARFSFHHNRPISCSAQCRHCTNPSVNFQLSFLVTCEQDTHILKLLHLEEHFVSIPECALVFFFCWESWSQAWTYPLLHTQLWTTPMWGGDHTETKRIMSSAKSRDNILHPPRWKIYLYNLWTELVTRGLSESNTHQEQVWIIASNIVQALMAVVQEVTGNGKLWDRHSILPNHPSKDALRDAMKCLL